MPASRGGRGTTLGTTLTSTSGAFGHHPNRPGEDGQPPPMDTSSTGSGDLPDEPDLMPDGVPAAEDDVDVSALDALLADVGSRRRRRPVPRTRTPDLDDALLSVPRPDLPPPPAGAGGSTTTKTSTTSTSSGSSSATATPVRRRRTSSSARPPVWRTLWPGGAAPNSERALPPPPMRRAARIERRFVWTMAVLAGLASVGSSVHPTGVGFPDVAAPLRLRGGRHPGRGPGHGARPGW